MKLRLLIPFLLACSPPTLQPEAWVETPTPATPSDAGADRNGLSTDLGTVCALLRGIGCPEGSPLPTGQTCFEHLLAVQATETIPIACLRQASSPESVRACGDPSTLRFRCRMP